MMKKHFIIIILLVAFFFFLLKIPGLPGTAQYTYDNLNRLVQVQYDDGTVI